MLSPPLGRRTEPEALKFPRETAVKGVGVHTEIEAVQGSIGWRVWMFWGLWFEGPVVLGSHQTKTN